MSLVQVELVEILANFAFTTARTVAILNFPPVLDFISENTILSLYYNWTLRKPIYHYYKNRAKDCG